MQYQGGELYINGRYVGEILELKMDRKVKTIYSVGRIAGDGMPIAEPVFGPPEFHIYLKDVPAIHLEDDLTWRNST